MKKHLCTFILLLFFFCVRGQDLSPVVFASGGVEGSVNDFIWISTIGETFTQTIGQAGLDFTMGFHQPETQTYGISENERFPGIVAYPNPVSSVLNIMIKQGQNSNFMVIISDLQGRKNFHTSVPGNASSIDLSKLESGVYLIQLYVENQLKSINRIIKY